MNKITSFTESGKTCFMISIISPSFLKNLCSAVFLHRFRPITVSFLVTRRCMINCPMCFIKKPSGDTDEMSFSEIKELFDILEKAGTKFLHLTGGEPFLRSDIPDIIKYAKEKRFYVTINTSGHDFFSYIEKIRSYTDTIILSIDGNRKTHDKIRGGGAFDRCLKIIDYCRENDIKLKINSVFGEFNKDQIPFLIELSKTKQVPITFKPVVKYSGIDRIQDFLPVKETVFSIMNMLLEEKKENKYIFMSDAYIRAMRDIKTPEHLSCDYLYMRINSDGKIKRCVLVDDRYSIRPDLRSVSAFLRSLKTIPAEYCDEPLHSCLETSNILNLNIRSVIEIFHKMGI